MAAARRAPRLLALAALTSTLAAVPAPALALSDVEDTYDATDADGGGSGVAPETAPWVGDTSYDAGCFAGSITLPPDTTVLPETSSQGLAIPLVLDGTSASMAETALTVVVQDALGAYVPGAFHVLGDPGLLVWTAETALGAGASYRVDVILDHDVLSGGCGDASGAEQYRYRVSVRSDAQVPPAPPELVTELVVHTSSTTTCCGDGSCYDTPWSSPELRAGLEAAAGLEPWQHYVFSFTVDGQLWREDRIAAQPGEWLERSLHVGDGQRHTLCVQAGVIDVFDESRTLGERRCESWTGNPPQTEPHCPQEDLHPGADGFTDGGSLYDDVDPGSGLDGGPAGNFGDDGSGADCACTSVSASGASQGAPLRGVLLALLGLGALVWRRTQGARRRRR